MQKNRSPVFAGLSDEAFEQLKAAACLQEKSFRKNEFILRAGDRTTKLGTVQAGSVLIENTDIWGHTGVLSTVKAGGVFAETYALCAQPLMVDVIAREDSRILFVDLAVLHRQDLSAGDCRQILLENLLDISARKNITLSDRIFCMSPKTIRGRVLAFLSRQAFYAETDTFVIPFDRQQMADYLNVDRTALSKELGKMKADGLINYHKNTFTICCPAET